MSQHPDRLPGIGAKVSCVEVMKLTVVVRIKCASAM